MLSIIGLAFDLVGAVALTLGLYRHPTPLMLGLSRFPEDVARDEAFGTVGASFLIVGFVLQGLQYVGVTIETTHAENAAAALVTIVAAVVVGWLVFGLVYARVVRREWSWAKANTEAVLAPIRRAPRGRFGWRFWNHEPADRESSRP
jgi:hypothetical protein